jgi:nuclear factor 6 (one cut domain family protein 1)
MGEKFGYPVATTPNVTGSFTVMQNNTLAQISFASPYASSYDTSKLVSMGMSPPHHPYQTNSGHHMGLHAHQMSQHQQQQQQQQHSPALSPQPYPHNGLHSPHAKAGGLSPNPYDYRNSLGDPQSPHDLSPHSVENERSPTSDPTSGNNNPNNYPTIYTSSTPLTSGNNPSLSGMSSLSPTHHHHALSPHPSPSGLGHHPHHHHHHQHSPSSPPLPHPSPILPPTTILHHSLPVPPQHSGGSQAASLKSPNSTTSSGGGGGEIEEINTKELAQRISAELKRYSIPQAIFAQRVLCRSQGTLSDLLRNPKPWSKLKSGRETFRRMFKWLQEPEFQRMSALRLAGEHTD